MLPTPAELSYFVEVASTLNLSRASERLGIAQPTLSLAIQRLEHSFGVKLLVRSKTGVTLTQSGQTVLGRVRRLIKDWEELRGEALKSETEVRGSYSLGCHPAVAIYSLPAILPALLKENPALELRLVHDLSRHLTEDVISFKVDFGIVVNPIEHPDLVIKLLDKDEVALWVSRSKSADRETLLCDPELLQTQSLRKQLNQRGISFKRTVTSSNLDVINSLVAAGVGVGILPGRVASRVPSQKLELFAPGKAANLRVQDRICLIYRADAQRTLAGKTVARAIEKNFRSRSPEATPV